MTIHLFTYWCLTWEKKERISGRIISLTAFRPRNTFSNSVTLWSWRWKTRTSNSPADQFLSGRGSMPCLLNTRTDVLIYNFVLRQEHSLTGLTWESCRVRSDRSSLFFCQQEHQSHLLIHDESCRQWITCALTQHAKHRPQQLAIQFCACKLKETTETKNGSFYKKKYHLSCYFQWQIIPSCSLIKKWAFRRL